MKHRQVWLFKEGRDLFKVIRTYWLLNPKCFNKAKCIFKRCSRLSAVLFGTAFSLTWSADEPSLWQIQQILAHKRYVELTHEFATGYPALARIS
jgi:hypothetical protein